MTEQSLSHKKGFGTVQKPYRLYDRTDNELKLPDGRTLGYAEYGSPNGFPILCFHGYPSSRLESAALHAVANKHSLRIIAPDRPGFGLSTYQPNRRLVDWPKDMIQLTEHLGLTKFSVMGASGGGPYALACAALIPPSKLTSVGLLASAPHWAAGSHNMTYTRQLLAYAAPHWPGVTGVVLGWVVGILQWMLRTPQASRWIESWLQKMDKAKKKEQDIEASSDEDSYPLHERRERLVRMLIGEPFAQGVDGTVLETQLLVQKDWGFKLEDVKHDKIIIWHGSKDKNAPIQMIRYMSERLPYCTMHEWDETHYTMGHRLEEVLKELASSIPVEDKQ